MKTIHLNKLISGKSFPEAGSLLFNEIESNIPTDNDKIILDLADVSALPSMFLNVSIGKFIEVHGLETLKNKIVFSNISTSQVERLKKYLSSFK